jgi:hypothetical protein
MLPCVTRALEEGYGVLVLNPNLNSVTVIRFLKRKEDLYAAY